MARNIEIKARVDDPDELAGRVSTISDGVPTRLSQDDTFFRCDDGRLKLRDFGDGTGELIHYRRADQDGPKSSHYEIFPTSNPDQLRRVLQSALGTIGRVRKQRIVMMIGRTRVHLDQVEGLGSFMELEVVLAPHESEQAGLTEAQELMSRLAIKSDSLIAGAYLDLLEARTE